MHAFARTVLLLAALAATSESPARAEDAPPRTIAYASLAPETAREALADLPAVPFARLREDVRAALAGFEASTGLSFVETVLANAEGVELFLLESAGGLAAIVLVRAGDPAAFERRVWRPLLGAAGGRRERGEAGEFASLDLTAWPGRPVAAWRAGPDAALALNPAGARALRAFAAGRAALTPEASDASRSRLWARLGALLGAAAPEDGPVATARVVKDGGRWRLPFSLARDAARPPLPPDRSGKLAALPYALDTAALFVAGRRPPRLVLEAAPGANAGLPPFLTVGGFAALVRGWADGEFHAQILESALPAAAAEGWAPGVALGLRTSDLRAARAALGRLERESAAWLSGVAAEDYRTVAIRSGALALLPGAAPAWATVKDQAILASRPEYARRLVDKTVDGRVHRLLFDLPAADWAGFVDQEALDRVNARLHARKGDPRAPLEPARLDHARFWAREEGDRIVGEASAALR